MLSILGALTLGVVAQAPVGSAFVTKLRTLVVFKEGFGFYVREGSAKLEDGWATTNLVPQAIGGTFWVYPKNPVDRVDTIVLTKDNRVEFDKPEELRKLLANKIDLRLRITTEGRQVVGHLNSLLEKMLLVQDDQKNYVAIEYGKIQGVSLVDFPVRVKLKTAKPEAPTDLGMAYVQEGVRWQPSYLLEMDGKKGRLTLRGTLLNLGEALKDANVVFVVGAPSLVNRGSIDDLLQGFMSGIVTRGLVGQSIDFISYDPTDNSLVNREDKDASPAAKAPGAPGGGFGGGGFGGRGAVTAGSRPSAFEAPVTSDETGELQYYTKPSFTLRPGERAMTTIFEIEIPITSLFEWDADQGAVTYILNLENKSEQPFTTGPVFVVENQRPVGQQMVAYTPPGGKTELRLAQGIGLKTEKTESEVRRGDPMKIGVENYLPITLKGTFTLENFRKEPAEVRIFKTLTGKVLDLGGGTVKDVQIARTGPNTVSRIEWKVTVPAGKKLEINYSYESYSSLGR